MGWSEKTIWWHVYPLSFTGAPVRPRDEGERALRHRLPRVTAWLDYLIELGCNGLLLGPIFASETHGYDTIDHFSIDPRLGDDADFDALVAAAKARGIRVVLDGVFNHVGRSFPRFEAAMTGDGEARAFFGTSADGGVALFENHPQLVALDHANPAVADYVAAVMRFWLARGIDGWRLDAAYAVPPSFWATVVPAVRAEFPAAWFVGEVIHGDYAGYVRSSGLDTLTQYELWKAIWSAIDSENFYELAYALSRHARYVAEFSPYTFVGNHDVTRIASAIGDPRHLTHAVAVLASVPGIPAIYAGDEQGLRALKEEREGGDDAIRPVFPPAPGLVPGGDARVLRDHQRLLGLRRRHPFVTGGQIAVWHLSNRAFVYEVADGGAGAAGAAPSAPGRVVVALNTSDDPLDLTALPATSAVPDGLALRAGDVLAGLGAVTAPENRTAPFQVLPPHSWAVYSPA